MRMIEHSSFHCYLHHYLLNTFMYQYYYQMDIVVKSLYIEHGNVIMQMHNHIVANKASVSSTTISLSNNVTRKLEDMPIEFKFSKLCGNIPPNKKETICVSFTPSHVEKQITHCVNLNVLDTRGTRY